MFYSNLPFTFFHSENIDYFSVIWLENSYHQAVLVEEKKKA